MVDWQVTAVTINCSAVAEDVTIIVKSDWSVKCTCFDRLAASRQARLDLVRRSLSIKRSLDCKGIKCPQIAAYVEKLQLEENQKADLTGEKK